MASLAELHDGEVRGSREWVYSVAVALKPHCRQLPRTRIAAMSYRFDSHRRCYVSTEKGCPAGSVLSCWVETVMTTRQRLVNQKPNRSRPSAHPTISALRNAPARLCAVACIWTLSGCASGVEVVSPQVNQNGAYQMNAEELALDCRKLTGRMQIRILQVRSYSEKRATSGLAKGLQSSIVPVFGGTTQGMSPDEQYAIDRAQLEAYNKQLVAKGGASPTIWTLLSPRRTCGSRRCRPFPNRKCERTPVAMKLSDAPAQQAIGRAYQGAGKIAPVRPVSQ